MSKKIAVISAVTAVVVIAGGFLGTTFWAGQSTEKALKKQHEWLADQAFFVVKKHDYQKGFFTATETTTFGLNPALFAEFGSRQEVANFELTYVQHIKHGPFPLLSQGNFTPLKAYVTTDVQYSAKVKEQLTKIFGDKQPLVIENRIAFNDDSQLSIKVPAFKYEEPLAGLKAEWKGLDVELNYNGDHTRLNMKGGLPGFSLDVKDHGRFSLSNLTMKSDQKMGKFGIMVGDASAAIGKVDVSFVENGKKIDASLDQLAYTAKLADAGEFMNAGLGLKLNKLLLDKTSYGPFDFQFEANHLHGATLGEINKEWRNIQRTTADPQAQGAALGMMMLKYGPKLLSSDPQIAVRKLEAILPEGPINFTGEITLKGANEADFLSSATLIKKISAKAEFTVPRKVVEKLVMWQQRDAMGLAEDEFKDSVQYQVAMKQIEEQIQTMADQKLVRIEGDKLVTSALFVGGKFTLNGTDVPLPW